MKAIKVLGLLALLLFLTLSDPVAVRAHEPHECPPGYPEAPAMPGHIDQSEIASGALSFDEIFRAGEGLFQAVFNHCDGQGRPATTGGGEKRSPDEPHFIRTSAPDSSSCAGCHNQPRAGGGGDFVANVFVLAQTLDPVVESVSPEFSNERNTLGMFGAGPIEMLGREMTADLTAIREAAIQEARQRGEQVSLVLTSKGVQFGSITAFPDGSVDTGAVKGVDPDLIVKPFHQAGVVRSIREFTANAMNHHHGMQAEERFDLNPPKGADYDQDGVGNELTVGDITAVTVFQAALGIPGRLLPHDRSGQKSAALGEKLFDQVGCASCHVPEMTLESRYFIEPNPLNPPGNFNSASQPFSFNMTRQGEGPYLEKGPGGTAVVRAFTDLKRHDLCDDPGRPDPIRFFCNEQLAQDRPDQDGRKGAEYFLTRKLWDVGSSAPYGHRGDLTTISEAILYHGGEARASRDAFTALSVGEQRAVVNFLKTLRILAPGSRRVVIASPHPGQVTLSLLSPWLIGAILSVILIWRRVKQGRYRLSLIRNFPGK